MIKKNYCASRPDKKISWIRPLDSQSLAPTLSADGSAVLPSDERETMQPNELISVYPSDEEGSFLVEYEKAGLIVWSETYESLEEVRTAYADHAKAGLYREFLA